MGSVHNVIPGLPSVIAFHFFLQSKCFTVLSYAEKYSINPSNPSGNMFYRCEIDHGLPPSSHQFPVQLTPRR